MELRSPDPSANPYLALAVCLAAGLDGIKNQIQPPDSVDQNIFQMTAADKKAAGIQPLPADLPEALDELEKDGFIRQVLGAGPAETYIQAKRAEAQQYAGQVTDWELEQYLYRI